MMRFLLAWVVLSFLTAPLIGAVLAANSPPAEEQE